MHAHCGLGLYFWRQTVAAAVHKLYRPVCRNTRTPLWYECSDNVLSAVPDQNQCAGYCTFTSVRQSDSVAHRGFSPTRLQRAICKFRSRQSSTHRLSYPDFDQPHCTVSAKIQACLPEDKSQKAIARTAKKEILLCSSCNMFMCNTRATHSAQHVGGTRSARGSKGSANHPQMLVHACYIRITIRTTACQCMPLAWHALSVACP